MIKIPSCSLVEIKCEQDVQDIQDKSFQIGFIPGFLNILYFFNLIASQRLEQRTIRP